MTDIPRQLYPFQEEGVNFLTSKGRAALGDDRGIGKNVQAAAALKRIGFNRALILTKKNDIYAGAAKIKDWFGEAPVIIEGPKSKRAELWKNPFVLTNYEIATKDWGLYDRRWDIVICNEAHKFRNRKSQAFLTVKHMHSKYFWALTGNPVRRGPQDLWTMLNLIDPVKFRGYWKFVETYCYVMKNAWGGFEVSGVRNPEHLKAMLKNYIIVRKKPDVLPDLPPKIREAIPIKMLPDQAKVYEDLAEKMLAELPSGDLLISPIVMAKIMRFRQLACMPKILDEGLSYGAALEHLADLLEDESREHRHVAVFTPFKAAIPFIVQRLEHLAPCYVVKGGMTSKKIFETVEACKANKGIAVMTIKVAESFDLETAYAAYFIGYEWDFDENEQAEDRLHRAITDHTIFANYYKHIGTIDSHILDVINFKKGTEKQIFPTIKDLKQSLEEERVS